MYNTTQNKKGSEHQVGTMDRYTLWMLMDCNTTNYNKAALGRQLSCPRGSDMTTPDAHQRGFFRGALSLTTKAVPDTRVF